MPLTGYSVLFDLDGTLVDSAPDLTDTLNTIVVRHGLPAVDEDEIRPLVGRGARLMIERALAIHGVAADPALVTRLFTEYLDEYGGRIAERSRPYDGVEAALDRLEEAGALIAVCTNKPEKLAAKLVDALGLGPRFRHVAGPETFGAAKPNPLHIVRLLEAIGGRRSRALMVGDTRTDVEAARNAGIPVIGVSFGYSDQPIAAYAPDRVIDTYAALYDVVVAIAAADAVPGLPSADR